MPRIVRAYGARGEVLDELKINWGDEVKSPFPREVILVQWSRMNTLTTTIEYSSVSQNVAISTSDFLMP